VLPAAATWGRCEDDGTVDCRSSQRYAVTVTEFASRVGLRVARNP
jgi:hypothetical protein